VSMKSIVTCNRCGVSWEFNTQPSMRLEVNHYIRRLSDSTLEERTKASSPADRFIDLCDTCAFGLCAYLKRGT
jgi:transcription elongation factor Elf1